MTRLVIGAAIALFALAGQLAPANAQHPATHEASAQGSDTEFDDSDWDTEAWGGEEENPLGAQADARWQEEAAAAEPSAEHEEHGGVDYVQLAAQITNFLMWLAIVVFLGRKPLAEFLKNRRLSVEEGLIEARDLKEAAEAKYEDYSERLEHLDDELAKLRSEMEQAGDLERARILEDAEAKAARMRRDTNFIIEQQMKQLRTDLTREAIDAAVSAAEKVLVDQVGSPDQTRLANDYLTSVTRTIQDEGAQA